MRGGGAGRVVGTTRLHAWGWRLIPTLRYRSSGGGQVLPVELAWHREDLAGNLIRINELR
jgi:hypothetical protein